MSLLLTEYKTEDADEDAVYAGPDARGAVVGVLLADNERYLNGELHNAERDDQHARAQHDFPRKVALETLALLLVDDLEHGHFLLKTQRIRELLFGLQVELGGHSSTLLLLLLTLLLLSTSNFFLLLFWYLLCVFLRHLFVEIVESARTDLDFVRLLEIN